jgi:hypothetical protein
MHRSCYEVMQLTQSWHRANLTVFDGFAVMGSKYRSSVDIASTNERFYTEHSVAFNLLLCQVGIAWAAILSRDPYSREHALPSFEYTSTGSNHNGNTIVCNLWYPTEYSRIR